MALVVIRVPHTTNYYWVWCKRRTWKRIWGRGTLVLYSFKQLSMMYGLKEWLVLVFAVEISI